ncbi:neutral amino acid transporter, partial [Cladochytrium tenue]
MSEANGRAAANGAANANAAPAPRRRPSAASFNAAAAARPPASALSSSLGAQARALQTAAAAANGPTAATGAPPSPAAPSPRRPSATAISPAVLPSSAFPAASRPSPVPAVPSPRSGGVLSPSPPMSPGSLPRSIPSAAAVAGYAVFAPASPIRGPDGILVASGSTPRSATYASFGGRETGDPADPGATPPLRPRSRLAGSVTPNPEVLLSEAHMARVVAEHLVSRSADSNSTGNPVTESESSKPVDQADQDSYGTSHSLPGGAVTSDIYRWQRRASVASAARRRNSEPDLSLPYRRTPDQVRASDLMEPGAFRRNYVATRAAAEGREPLNFTRNFIDFLVLYGFYGGDVVPEEEEEEDEEAAVEAAVTAQRGLAVGETRPPAQPPADEVTPLLHRRASTSAAHSSVKGTSDRKAFFMLVKAFVGTGVLFLPKAFANGGMGFSVFLMIVLAWLSLHCMLLLVETSRKLGGSFGDVGEKLYGPGVRSLVLASIAISQAGFCCAYYIFVAQNMRDLLMITSDCKWVLPDWIFLLVQLAIYVPLSWVRRIKHFHLTSLVADAFIFAGLGYIFYFDLAQLAARGPARDVAWVNLESFPLFIGTAMFAFEGICLILPIAESMKRPERFGGILSLVMLLVCVVFVAIGA